MGIESRSVAHRVIKLAILGILAFLLILQGIFMERYGFFPHKPITSEVELAQRFHSIMYRNPALWSLKWFGIPTQQNPMDIWIIQEIIADTKPDFIVETGTYKGGGAALWAMLLREANPDGRVITIDIVDLVKPENLSQNVAKRIDFMIGNSVDPALVEKVRAKVLGKRVLVILDSNHHKDHVLSELQCYSPMVGVGCYLIVQDTDINGHPVYTANSTGPGPMEAVQEFLASNSHFESDKTREKLLFTMHPNGYLKRVE